MSAALDRDVLARMIVAPSTFPAWVIREALIELRDRRYVADDADGRRYPATSFPATD